KELAIQYGCAAVGNCALVLYGKTRTHYRSLLVADMVQTMNVLKTSSHGFRDLKIGTHDSAFDTYFRIFRYDGKKYKRTKCWSEIYAFADLKGKWHDLKKPLIRNGCGAEF